jgi:hypothetical protein
LETVRTIERTKSSFKSKELGQLRIKLEQLLEKAKKLKSFQNSPITTKQEK